jgi:hypothetical protein
VTEKLRPKKSGLLRSRNLDYGLQIFGFLPINAGKNVTLNESLSLVFAPFRKKWPFSAARIG